MMSQHNRHHVLYPKAVYNRYEAPRFLRNDPAMIHTIPVEAHNEIHATLPPPPLISSTLARVALQFIYDHPYNTTNMEKFEGLIGRFNKMSRRVGKYAIEAGKFAEHFDKQLELMGDYKDGRT